MEEFNSDQHALQSSQKEENPFKRMAREYALQETIIYNYLVWLTIKYDKQFSDYKESKKRRSLDWWEFIKTLPLKVEDKTTFLVYFTRFTSAHMYDPLPSQTEALETLVDGTEHGWIEVIEDVYKHRQEIEKQKDLIKELFFIW